MDDSKLPKPFRIEHICELPFNLAKTELAVRPCVAFLHSDDESGKLSASVEESMIPRLDAKEVAAVFSAPFHNFLRAEDEQREGEKLPGKPSDWYSGTWTNWHEGQWRMHFFWVPIDNQVVTKPKVREGGQAAIAEQLDEAEEAGMARYKVWGMTARILVDAARVAYGEEPTFEVRSSPRSACEFKANNKQHNSHFGDEAMMEKLFEMGMMSEKKKAGSEFTQQDLLKAAAAAKTKM
jgi:coenzyme A diphosphatase NUDT7